MESQFRGKKSEEERWREGWSEPVEGTKEKGLSKKLFFLKTGGAFHVGRKDRSVLRVWVESWAMRVAGSKWCTVRLVQPRLLPPQGSAEPGKRKRRGESKGRNAKLRDRG